MYLSIFHVCLFIAIHQRIIHPQEMGQDRARPQVRMELAVNVYKDVP